MTFEKFLYELKQRNDIVEVISEFLEVKQKGNSFWICCPFHNESDPSLSISHERQFFHCFGCKESGDVIKFVQKFKGLEFLEAVKFLAERAHIEIPSFTAETETGKKNKEIKSRLFEICKATALFYYTNLNEKSAREYVEYLEKRKVPLNIAKKFGIGASTDWDSLPKYLKSKGFSEEEMIKSGTVSKSDNGKLFDALGERLIFPIINNYGEVIAFGGRTLKKDAHAKYKNTSQTLLFDKSKSLYNINLLKKLKIKDNTKSAIMVEGYMDTVALNKAGIENVVASMGTSLTIDQARLLKKYVDNVYICYDGDSAGQAATLRGLDILDNEGLSVKVVTMPEGLDPDEYIGKYGKESYYECLKNAKPLVLYKLEKLISSYDLEKIDDKNKCVQACLKVIKVLPSVALREEYLKFLRDNTGVSFEALMRDMENVNAVAKAKVALANEPINSDNKKLFKAIRFILGSYLLNRDFPYVALGEVANFFTSNAHINIYKYIVDCKKNGKKCSILELTEFIGNEYKDEIENIEKETNIGDLTLAEINDYFNACKNTLKKEELENRINTLKYDISQSNDDTEKDFLQKELWDCISKKMAIII